MNLGWYTDTSSYKTLQDAWIDLGLMPPIDYSNASKYGIYAYDKQSAIKNKRNVSQGNIYHDGSHMFLGAVEIASWHVIPVSRAQQYVTSSQSRSRPRQTDTIKIWCVKPGEPIRLPKSAWALRD